MAIYDDGYNNYAVDPDGTKRAFELRSLSVRDRTGRLLAQWKSPSGESNMTSENEPNKS